MKSLINFLFYKNSKIPILKNEVFLIATLKEFRKKKLASQLLNLIIKKYKNINVMSERNSYTFYLKNNFNIIKTKNIGLNKYFFLKNNRN